MRDRINCPGDTKVDEGWMTQQLLRQQECHTIRGMPTWPPMIWMMKMRLSPGMSPTMLSFIQRSAICPNGHHETLTRFHANIMLPSQDDSQNLLGVDIRTQINQQWVLLPGVGGQQRNSISSCQQTINSYKIYIKQNQPDLSNCPASALQC